MFRLGFDIQRKYALEFCAKAIDVERNIIIRQIGSKYPKDGKVTIFGCEYNNKIYPFVLDDLSIWDILPVTPHYLHATRLKIQTYEESEYFKNGNPFFINKEKLVFSYENIEEYQNIMSFIIEGLQVILWSYTPDITDHYYPRYVYDVYYEDMPPGMRASKGIICLGDIMFGGKKKASDLSIQILDTITTCYKHSEKNRIIFQTKNKKNILLHRIKELGGIEYIKYIKQEKEKEVFRQLDAYWEIHSHPKTPQEIIERFKYHKITNLDDALMELNELVAVGAERHYSNSTVELLRYGCLTSPAVIKVLKQCYESELQGISDCFEQFALKLTLRLSQVANIGNMLRQKANCQREYEAKLLLQKTNYQNHYRKNRYKFWKPLR